MATLESIEAQLVSLAQQLQDYETVAAARYAKMLQLFAEQQQLLDTAEANPPYPATGTTASVKANPLTIYRR